MVLKSFRSRVNAVKERHTILRVDLIRQWADSNGKRLYYETGNMLVVSSERVQYWIDLQDFEESG